MTDAKSELATAERMSEAARAQLTLTLVDIQAKFDPRALAKDALAELHEVGTAVATGAVDLARRNPLPLVVFVATMFAVLTRDRLSAALRRKRASTDGVRPGLSGADASLTEG